MTSHIPYFRETVDSQQLVVNGEPFLILGGELQNSTFSSSKYMKSVWEKLTAANLNTVLGSIAWEQIEPVEDEFDFEDLDQLIHDARTHSMKVVLLWFGSFKNGLSTYVPSWVKKNAKRFPRAVINTSKKGATVGDVLSIFGSEAPKADAKAFKALLAHLREIDEYHSTVVMVQVENEVGLLGDSRDRSSQAETAWNSPMPSDFVRNIQSSWPSLNKDIRKNFEKLESMDPSNIKSWHDIPGEKQLVEELFMAYHYALYVEQVASAGKSVYPLPLYTNVWQNYASDTSDKSISTVAAGGGTPGDYPCGGGVTNTLDIWKMYATSLDIIAPDIYLNDYDMSCAAYRHRNQALFIPEQRRDEYGARRVWSAFGSHQAIGTAPFGIDTVDPLENPFRRHYGLLKDVTGHILEAQALGKGHSAGFFFDELREDGTDPSPSVEHKFGDWNLKIERSFVFGKPSPGSGLVIWMESDVFLLVGWGFQVTFSSTNPQATFSGILQFHEKEVVKGKLQTLRILNGDETRSGKFAIMPSENPDYGGFPISITIPSHTGIATCEPYALVEEDSVCLN